MNFTVIDTGLSTAAFLLFGIFLVPPGYALAWLLDLCSFRSQPGSCRLLISLPFSIALTPILVYLLGRFSLGWPVWIFYALCLLVFLATLRRAPIPRAIWLAISACFLIGVVSLIDLQIGNRLYYSVAAYDFSFRASITGAFVRASQLPAANPFFFTGTPQPFRYHYFWFLLASLPIRLSEAVFGHTLLAPRYAVVASAIWAALGLLALAGLYVRFVLKIPPPGCRRIAWICAGLFLVSGLDIVPMLPQQIAALFNHDLPFYPTLEWWNSDQVTNWVDTVLWVPHAAAAAIACLTAFLILWDQPRFRWQTALGAGLAFASAAGLSVYVTAAFAAFCAFWILYLALMRCRAQAVLLICAGIFALALAAPFLRELTANSAAQTTFARLTVRKFDPFLQALDALDIPNDGESGWLTRLGNLFFLPLNYFFEFGVFLFAGAAWLKARLKEKPRWTPRDVALILLATVPLVCCSFIRSATINMNDFGARGLLPAQFALVLITALWLDAGGLRRRAARALLAIGLLTSAYELALLRLFPILSDFGLVERSDEIAGDPDSGLRGFSARQVYTALDLALPLNAVLQHDPDGNHDILAGLYANRQFALRDLPTAITFSGNAAAARAAFTPLTALFAGDRDDARAICRALSIDALVPKDNDDAWNERQSWVWTGPLLAGAERARAIGCGVRSYKIPTLKALPPPRATDRASSPPGGMSAQSPSGR